MIETPKPIERGRATITSGRAPVMAHQDEPPPIEIDDNAGFEIDDDIPEF